MARAKKKHICEECGESFKHGIGLRKHQRQTGHKGSRVETAESEAPAPPPPAEEPAPAPEPEPEPVAPAAQEPAPEPVAEVAQSPEPAAPAQEYSPEPVADPDQTVAVPRPTAQLPAASPAPVQSSASYPEVSASERRKQKIDLVSRGLKVVVSAKAKDASKQIKRSAKSGAEIFTEAVKLAVALTCFFAIPTFIFFWWKSHNPSHRPGSDQQAVFRIDAGATAARSSLLRYLDHLGKARWEEAYALLTPDWRAQLGFGDFKDAFLDIEDIRWAVVDQKLYSATQADVLVRLAFSEGGRSRNFLGKFRLLMNDGSWKVDRAEISPSQQG